MGGLSMIEGPEWALGMPPDITPLFIPPPPPIAPLLLLPLDPELAANGVGVIVGTDPKPKGSSWV
jgi:hypothetical protein